MNLTRRTLLRGMAAMAAVPLLGRIPFIRERLTSIAIPANSPSRYVVYGSVNMADGLARTLSILQNGRLISSIHSGSIDRALYLQTPVLEVSQGDVFELEVDGPSRVSHKEIAMIPIELEDSYD
jgi:hypothetical protein